MEYNANVQVDSIIELEASHWYYQLYGKRGGYRY